MRKQFTKYNKHLYQPDKANRAAKFAYSKVKNECFAKDYGLVDDWETENEFVHNTRKLPNNADISK